MERWDETDASPPVCMKTVLGTNCLVNVIMPGSYTNEHLAGFPYIQVCVYILSSLRCSVCARCAMAYFRSTPGPQELLPMPRTAQQRLR